MRLLRRRLTGKRTVGQFTPFDLLVAMLVSEAAGPSIAGRTGIRGESVPRTDPVFDLISDYVAQRLFNTYVNLRPEKMVLGGSVLSAAELPKIRRYFAQYNHGYITTPPLEALIVMTTLANNTSATVGDFALAQQALDA